ncbi:MAG TPA: L,D-transpeptidase family protein [Thermoanaerobaculia bacterium]|nr:L,D-transpeptidase family protein [Thermoanaerobaculia bacterium]
MDARRRRAIFGAALLAAALMGSGAAGQTGDVRSLVAAGRLDGMRWPEFGDLHASLESFYAPAAYAPAWLRGTQPVPQALSLIEIFRNAERKGLDPEDYDADRWEGRIRALQTSRGDAAAARFDVALTVCAIRYVSALQVGRIDPNHLEFGLTIDGQRYDLARFLRERVLCAQNPASVLEQVESPLRGYRRTERALERYLELARADDADQLPAVSRPVDPGESWAGTPRLVRFLKLVGDLPADAGVPDDSRIYGGALVDAVRRFQRRHSLADDGRIGAATIGRLNVPLGERVRQLQLALERWRWLGGDLSGPRIVVNIPGFRLRALDESLRVALEMRVVVGEAMRTETPVFAAEMTHVILRPYWNVPRGILRREILPAVVRNRGYLARNRFEVTTHDGAVVTSGGVSDDVLARLRSGELTVRQRPGPKNSLGLVKLMFPNEYSVYLHDTPAQQLFARSRRDFSHGCIRVEKAAELAAWALRNNPGWTLERLRREMTDGKDDVTVNLATPVPVAIVYTTAFAEENGEVHFFDDIYRHDAELAAQLARGYPYP